MGPSVENMKNDYHISLNFQIRKKTRNKTMLQLYLANPKK